MTDLLGNELNFQYELLGPEIALATATSQEAVKNIGTGDCSVTTSDIFGIFCLTN